MHLDLTTVLFEVLNFGVLMLLLARLLFRPVRRVVEERRTEIDRARAEVATAAETTQAVRASYDARRLELEGELDTLRRTAREEGEAAAARIVDEARERMRQAQSAIDAEVEIARARALDELRPQIVRLAIDASRHVIRDMEAPEIALAHARRAALRLREECARAGEPEGVRVLVSPDADLYAVSLAMREVFGATPVELHVDEGLVGGVHMIAGNTHVRASAGDSLERWLSVATAASASASPPAGEATA